MEVKDILIVARQRITDPAHWTTKVNARNANGNPIDPLEPKAVCWCAIGAIVAQINGVSTIILVDDAEEYMDNFAYRKFGRSLVSTNDDLGHAVILELFDEAIRAL